VNYIDANILRGVDCVDEFGVARDAAGKQLIELPLVENVISWYSPVLGMGDGFGNSSERMILAIERRGQYVAIEPHIASSGQTLLDEIRNRKYEYGAVRVAYCPPGVNMLPKHANQATLGFSMWEDDTLPPFWDQYITQVDAMAAPSKFCVDLFRDRLAYLGSDVPVCYVPLGVQTDFYKFKRRSAHPNQCFTFLHSSTSTWDQRKGVDQAVKAFREAFTAGENVKLVIRARMGQVETFGDERIDVRIKMQTEQEKLDTLYEAHALVYPSTGEGLGLIPLEAIASGLPTLCSANTGMLDYQELFTPLRCDPEPSRIAIVGYESTGTWQRPRQIELVLGMRDLFSRYREAVAFSASAAKAVQKWSYDRSAVALIEAIGVARAAHRAKQA
jgi:glycosyltransferase involved in cell wall biosynthesis